MLIASSSYSVKRFSERKILETSASKSVPCIVTITRAAESLMNDLDADSVDVNVN